MSKRPLARARSPFHWHLSPMVVGSSKLTHLIIFRTDAMESGESDSSDADSERDGYAIGSDGEDDPQVRVAYTCLAATSATQPLQQFRPVTATFLNFTFLVSSIRLAHTIIGIHLIWPSSSRKKNHHSSFQTAGAASGVGASGCRRVRQP